MFELIINILLFHLPWLHVLHPCAGSRGSRECRENPYALQPDVWPKTIIILLEICLIVNIIQIIKKNKGNPDFTLGRFCGEHPRLSSRASCSWAS